MRTLTLTLFVVLFACACNTANNKDILAANMDTTVVPGDDFFNFANGGWIKKNPIPDEESAWGIGNLVINENLNRLKKINEKAAANKAQYGTVQQKIGAFWNAAMDTLSIDKNGLMPLNSYLQKIDAINDLPAITATMAELEKIGVESLVGMYIGQDDKNSDVIALQFWQSGLYLGEREYYLKTDTTSKNIVAKYKQLITNILVMSDIQQSIAETSANNIVQLETQLAKVHRKLEDLRNPYRNYNKMSFAALYKLSPALNMQQYCHILNIPKIDSVIVGQPEYYKALESVLKKTSVTTWKHFLRFRLIDKFAEALPDSYGKEKFAFAKLLSGAKERKPRWKRVLQNEEKMMGELLGQLFAKEYFTDKTKKRYEDLVEAIRESYKERIEQLTWMSDSTKQKALIKLAAIKKKVGYPNKWKDFSSLEITKESYVQNLINGNVFWFNYELNKLGKPVDRDEWNMYPQTYNAYYNASNNEIVLPAGIFTVPGCRDEQLDDALVYGYAGASTIGHEITHGFDDQGREYDEKGNLRNWWTAKDEQQFNERSQKMTHQFNQYVVVDTFKINGKATLGENIADLGGIILGWNAFQKTEQFKQNKSISNLNPAQRYFMGYALGWLGHTRKEALRNQVLTDVHSPAKFRVNGPFADVDEFYTVFNVQPINKMFLTDTARVRIW